MSISENLINLVKIAKKQKMNFVMKKSEDEKNYFTKSILEGKDTLILHIGDYDESILEQIVLDKINQINNEK